MVFWIVWSALGALIAILFACIFVPRIVFKLHASTLPVRDRAIGRSVDEHGAVLFFEPAASVKKFISSYRIARDGNGLYFCGEWARKIAYCVYELVVYGASGGIIEIIRVKEKFNGGAETHRVRLPKKADYVTLRLVCADDTPYMAERKKLNLRFVLWLAVLCLVLVFSSDLLLWISSNLLIRIVYGFSTPLEPSLAAWCSLLGYTALGVTVFTCIFAFGHLFLLRRKGDGNGD